jgi:hypothetical protein
MRFLRRINYLIGRNNVIQKLSSSKVYMFYTMKMMYYKFGWLIKFAKKILIK